ncbi:MAG: hypothetical protein IKZ08_02650 [Bacteroidales bacterium]|nr:hypothetical protein [Bacteroidales bacterium]
MEVIMLVVGVLIGFVLTIWIMAKKLVGTLHVVQTNLEVDPQLLLDLDYPVHDIMGKSYVLMKVDHISTRK